MHACTGSNLVGWAINALEKGFDSLSLRLLAGLSTPTNEFEVDELLQQLDAEVGIGIPSEEQLLEVYAGLTADDIVSRRISAQEGCRRLGRLALLSPPKAPSEWIVLDEELDLAREGYVGPIDAIEERIVAAAQSLLTEKTRTKFTR
jgi:hypothetical protein